MRIGFVCLFLIAPSILYAQSEVYELPIHFGQYFNNPQINPAQIRNDGDLEFFAGSRSNRGNFGGISTSFFSANFKLNSKKDGFNVVGAYFNNDKEGDLIRRSRGYGSYARHQQINTNWFLAVGFSLGLYNFSIKSNPTLGGISGGGFDGNAGLYLYRKKTRLGLSVNQFSNTKVQPLDQVIRLVRHYYFTGEHDLSVTSSFKLIPSIFMRYTENEVFAMNKWHYGGALNFLLQDIVGFGASYEKNARTYFFVGIENIHLTLGERSNSHDHKLNIHFSFLIPNANSIGTNTRTLELVISYFIDKSEK